MHYAWQVALSVPARLVFAPLPPHVDALALPLALPATCAQFVAAAPLGANCPVGEWPAGLPFRAALRTLLDQHRGTVVLVASPYAGQAVPRNPAMTPVLHLLTQPPCLVLVHPPGFAQVVPRTILAMGPPDRHAGAPGWPGTIAQRLLQVWRPRVVVLGAAGGPLLGGPAAWQAVLTGLAQTPVVTALPTTPAHLLAEATRYEAELLLLVLRARETLREQRQTLLLTVLQSPVPVLLLPLVG